MADKKVKGAGDRFLPGSNIAKHREWRGLKDTWYDYVEWVKVLGIMGGFVAKSPVRIARGMLTYRWMGSYLAALNMIDRCVEGLRGPALRVARLYLNTIMKGSTTSIAEMMMGDRRFDIEGAAAAGMESIGVLWGYGSREELEKASPDYLAADIPELRRILG